MPLNRNTGCAAGREMLLNIKHCEGTRANVVPLLIIYVYWRYLNLRRGLLELLKQRYKHRIDLERSIT